MEKFEYMILRSNNLPLVGNGHEDEQKLNELGGKGWELLQVETSNPITLNLLFFSTTKMHKERIFYLKRRKSADVETQIQ